MEDDSACNRLSFSCPSFNSYSADAGTRAADERPGEPGASISGEAEESEFEFEFATLRSDPDGGGFVFPVFDHGVLAANGIGKTDLGEDRRDDDAAEACRVPLRELFLEGREVAPSSSSCSEADELEEIPSDTYCVWSPAKPRAESSPSRCEKSKSTGSSSTRSLWSSKRWRFKDLLKRSHSDGKESYVVLDRSPLVDRRSSPSADAWRRGKRSSLPAEARGGRAKEKEKEKASSAHEAFYLRTKASKDGDRRKSYLPYRQDLVGLFSSKMNGLGRPLPPF